MKQFYTFLTTVLFSIGAFQLTIAQPDPFNCDYNAFLFQYNDVYALDLASGNAYLTAEDVTPGNINAAGYNPKDGFMWGSLSSPEKSIVKIGKNYQTEIFQIPELPTNNRYVGDISADGIYYLKPGGTTYYKVDLDPESPNYTQSIGTGTLSSNINIHDWAFNAVDNQLYTVEKGTNRLYRIDPVTGIAINIGEVPILSGFNYTYGAVYFDASGHFYVSANQTGTVYIIYSAQSIPQGGTIVSNLFAYGPASSSNDGARCPTAPVPQEICDNGIDDDGDGLIDCEDPACSGISGCPVESGTSGGSEGGLESNNRLSQKINQRNFNRVKSGYRFSRENALRFSPKIKPQIKANGNIDLQSLIPNQVLSNTEVIVSTPQDLQTITNADEVFSVDYLRSDKTIAALLLLKTNGSVYEHTKFICDRLLGSQILSVNTIEIQGHLFTRALIRNSQGQNEFVLSFSAVVPESSEEAIIESHWNLDAYPSGGDFYNVQLWTQSLDDLEKMGSAIIDLFSEQVVINGFNASPPPTVFVKSGSYKNGRMSLELINTNQSEEISIVGGISRTETSETELFNVDLSIGNETNAQVELNTGALFDFGFRLSAGQGLTPDDLFLSDGVWGYDDFAASTHVNYFEISASTGNYVDGTLPLERSVEINAETQEYINVYRSLNPRFQPVNLNSFRSLEFEAQGTGELVVTLVKSSIQDWNLQPKFTIQLFDRINEYTIPFDLFKSNLSETLPFDDVNTVVFTMESKDGQLTTKTLNLSNVRFGSSDESNLNIPAETNFVSVAPNPITTSSHIYFHAPNTSSYTLEIFTITGQLIYSEDFVANQGNNNKPIGNIPLNSGIYLFQLMDNTSYEITGKIIKQ